MPFPCAPCVHVVKLAVWSSLHLSQPFCCHFALLPSHKIVTSSHAGDTPIVSFSLGKQDGLGGVHGRLHYPDEWVPADGCQLACETIFQNKVRDRQCWHLLALFDHLPAKVTHFGKGSDWSLLHRVCREWRSRCRSCHAFWSRLDTVPKYLQKSQSRLDPSL